MELNNLRERTLLQCSYSDALDIVIAMENVKALHLSGIEAIEELETYLSFVLILKGRLANEEFPELRGNDRRREKSSFLSRLNLLHDKISFALEVNIRFNKHTSQIFEWVSEVSDDLENKRKDIEDTANAVREEIDESEHNILAHVLSLMGIFSAIITLIMSVVITSASWLNTANGASAIIAFIVPNLVTLIAVFTLLSLIFFYLHRDTPAQNGKCAKHKRSIAFTITIIALILCVILCCWICLSIK